MNLPQENRRTLWYEVIFLLTVRQSVRPSWLRTPFGTHGNMFASLDFMVFVCRGASSLTGGQACRLTGHNLCLCRTCIPFYLLYIFYLLFFSFILHLFVFFFLVKCVYTYTHLHNYILDYVHVRPASPGIVQLIMSNYCFYCSLDTWTIVRLTATKCEPFMLSMLGFAFACVSNIHNIMILNDSCLLPVYFGYTIANIRNLERQSMTWYCVLQAPFIVRNFSSRPSSQRVLHQRPVRCLHLSPTFWLKYLAVSSACSIVFL